MNKFLLFFVSLVFLSAPNLYSQTVVKFNHIPLNDEHMNLEIFSIIRDSRGYMWFGTDNGLIQFDGYKIKEFKNNYFDTTTIGDNRIFDIHEDKAGALWLASFSGLDKYDRISSTFSHYYLERKETDNNMLNFVLQVLVDKNERKWVKKANGGLYLLNPETRNFKQVTGKENDLTDPLQNDVIYSHMDRRGNIWFSVHYEKGSRLGYYNSDTKKIVSYIHNPDDQTSLSMGYARTILEDSKGNLWVGLEKGIDKLNVKTGKFTHYLFNASDKAHINSGKVMALEEDDFGMIWAGTEKGGLYRLSLSTGMFDHFQSDPNDPNSLRSNNILSLYNDKVGTLWIGTERGVNSHTFNYKKFNNYHYSSNGINIPSSNYILDACIDKNNDLWYCTEKGVYKFNKKGQDELMISVVCDEMEIDNTGRFWLSEEKTLLMSFNAATRKAKKYYARHTEGPDTLKSSIWSLYQDEKTIWFGTGMDGVNGMDMQTGKITAHFLNDPSDSNSISKNAVGPLLRDKDLLWIGPYGAGLNSINLKTRKVTRYNHDSKDLTSLSNNIVVSIYRDRKNRLWVGTEGGLNLLLPNGQKFKRFKVNDGRVYSICEDNKSNIWFTTLTGISKIHPETFVIRNYDSNDGFQINPASRLVRNSKGEIIVFGQNGFTIFDPEEIIDNILPPLVSVNDFQIFNKSIVPGKNSPLLLNISETKKITLSYKESFFTFEFAAHNYVSPEKNQYAYRLEGFESDWNYVGTRRFAYYTNVPAGKYTFRVKASNNDGIWSETDASIKINITPPFWQTWWFRIIASLFVIGSVVIYFRLRMRAVKRQSEVLELVVNERTELLAKSIGDERKARQEAEKAKEGTEQANEELEQKNKELEQFAYVASHDMQEPLRTTSSFVELLQRQYKGKLDDNADKYLTFIAQSSDRMKVLIKDLLDYSRIGRKRESQQVDCSAVLQAVIADLAIAIAEAGAHIRVDPLPVISAYPTEIKQLFQNLLTNAIKFRKKDISPQIKISAQQAQNYWEFSVKDNGIGIEEKHAEKIFIIFQRLHTREQYEGSGIGLAHCKKIVELHGGKIRIESKQGEGTTFNFTIRKDIN